MHLMDLRALVIALPSLHGWSAELEFPGYVAWYHPDNPDRVVYATPDHEGIDGIAFEICDAHGHVLHVEEWLNAEIVPSHHDPVRYAAIVAPFLRRALQPVRTLTMAFDVTFLTQDQIDAFQAAVMAQTEGLEDDEELSYPPIRTVNDGTLR